MANFLMANFKVVIVGAGVVGACCARTLARCGADVLVVDQGEAVGVRGGTAAGMGHIVINDGDEAGLQLCKLGRSIWREDCPELAGADGFSETGTLWMAEDDDAFNELANSAARLEAEGIHAELLVGKSFHDAEPALARDLVGGLRVPEDGVLYAPVVAAAMVDQAKQLGATFRPRVRVSSVESGVVRLDDGNSIGADAILIASGLNALDLLDESGSKCRSSLVKDNLPSPHEELRFSPTMLSRRDTRRALTVKRKKQWPAPSCPDLPASCVSGRVAGPVMGQWSIGS